MAFAQKEPLGMIKVNFRDGTTLAFDLNKEADRKQWLEWSSVADFQKRITGVGILHNKRFLTVPFPKRFRKIQFFAELVYSEKKGEKRLLGEKLICHADEIKLTVLVYTYKDPPPPVLSRIDMERIGKQMFPGAMGFKGGKKK